MSPGPRPSPLAACGLLLAVAVTGCGRVGFDAAAGPHDATSTDMDMSSDAAASLCSGPRLIAHWRLDETTGATIVDSAGNHDGMWMDANDGTVAAEAKAGHRDGALFFGSGSRVIVPGFLIPSEGTFSAWLTSSFDESVAFSGSHPILIDAGSPRTTVSFDSDMRVYGLRTNDVSWQASYAPPADYTTWFHLTGTWSATGARVYIDGVPVGAAAIGDARSTSSAGLYLGTREQLDRMWDGLIDDVRFYDYAMDPAEVQKLVTCP